LSVTDPLTGLANRRRFADVLEAEWERALRLGTCIAIAVVDVDHFNSYNDRYGHISGDACLRCIAAALNSAVREGVDLVARYGGEEFVLVLPGVSLKVAGAIAERVRAAVQAIQRPHEDVPSGFVTVSIGIAACRPSADMTSEQLVQAADVALYQAKQNGEITCVRVLGLQCHNCARSTGVPLRGKNQTHEIFGV
jgi:diguanylate cyclase (GGDEF)-like protein